MVRCRKYLEVIQAERLIDQALRTGAHLQQSLLKLEKEFPEKVSNARGRGLFCAIDFAGADQRKDFIARCFNQGLIILPCGERSARFRTALNIDRHTLDEGLRIIHEVVAAMPM